MAYKNRIANLGAGKGSFMEKQGNKETISRWGRILENSFDEIYVFDAKSLKFVQVSRGALLNLGYSMEEMLHLTPWAIKPDLSQEDFEQLVAPLRAGQQERVVFETRHQRNDGSLYPVEVRLQLAEEESPPVFIAIIHDITERKHNEEALATSEMRFRALVEQSPFSIQVFSPDGHTIVVNRAWEKLWGVTADALEGYTIFEDQQLIEKGIMPYIKKGFAGEAVEIPPVYYETGKSQQIPGPGLTRCVRAFIYPIKDRQGNILEVILMHENVQEREQAQQRLRESESRFHSLAQISPVGIFRTDTNGNCIYVNERWLEMAGMQPEEAMGEGWVNALYPADRQRVAEEWYQAAKARLPFRTECRFQRPDGKVTWLLAQAVAEEDAEKRVSGYVGTITDISANKRIEEAIRRIAEGVSAGSGELFFQQMVENLAQLFDADIAFIGLLDEHQPDTINTFAFYDHGKIVDNISYRLENTPCASVVGQSTCFYFSGIQQQFPNDPLLAEMGMESYIGTPLFDSQDNPLGLIVLMNSKPIGNIEQLHPVMGIFAARAGAELERLQAGKELRKSEERFAKAFRSSPEPIIISRMEDGCLLDVNEGFERITGYRREEVLGKTVEEINLWQHAEKRQRMIELLQQEGKLRNYMGEFRKKNNEKIIVELSAEVIELDGQACLVVLAKDVTELKQTEEALAKSISEWNHAMDYFNDALVIVDLNDRVIRANSAFYRLTSLIPEQVIGKDVGSILHAAGEEVSCPACRARKKHKDALIVLEADDPDNFAGRPVEIMVRTIRDYQDEPQSVLMAIHDLSRQRAIENELRQHRDNLEELVTERTRELEAANKELETFSYSVSHDLRTPLRSINGFSQAVLEDYAEQLDDTGKDYLQRINSASRRMNDLIDDMLKLSRLSRFEFNREDVDMSMLAESVVNQLKELEGEREVNISIAPGLKAQGDKKQLDIVLVNLFGNAWKYTRNTENASIEFGATENGEKIFYIKDNGAGFDMRYADKLFGVFQRFHNNDEFEGTGIGLATVQRIIHRHGGRIWAEAEVGKGATFYFTLSRVA